MQPSLGPTNGQCVENKPCRFCGQPVSTREVACTRCGFPAHGSLEQQKAFARAVEDMHATYRRNARLLGHARRLLLLLAMLVALPGLYVAFGGQLGTAAAAAGPAAIAIGLAGLAAGTVLMVCAIWLVPRNPTLGFLAPLALLGILTGLHILNYFRTTQPSGWQSGAVILHAIGMAALYLAQSKARENDELRPKVRRLEQLNDRQTSMSSK